MMAGPSLPETMNNLTVFEVYEFYDRPLLYSAQDALGRFYLLLYAGSVEDAERWLAVALSQRRLREIRSGTMSLHNAFSSPEEGLVYELHQSSGGDVAEVQTLQAFEIDSQRLPVPGERLEIHAPFPHELPGISAHQTNREAIRLRLHFTGSLGHVAPVRTLSEILLGFQKAVNDLSVYRFAQYANLLVTAFLPGSFEVELESEETADMFGFTKTGESLQEIFELLRLTDKIEMLELKLGQLDSNSADSYLEFLKSIHTGTTSADLTWASPKDAERGQARVTQAGAQKAVAYLEGFESVEEEFYKVQGRFRAINLDTMYFRLQEVVQDERRFTGRFDRDVFDDEAIAGIRLDKIYSVSIQIVKTHERGTGKTDEDTKILAMESEEDQQYSD